MTTTITTATILRKISRKNRGVSMLRKSTSHAAKLAVIGIVLLFIASLAAAQTTPATKVKSTPEHTELANAPVKAVERRNPLETDPEAVAAGAKLFGLHCSECHGPSAEGARRGPSLRDDEVQLSTPGTLFWLLTNGVVRKGMPVWSKLPEPQRWQLVSYIKSLSPRISPKAEEGKTPHP